MVNILIFYKEQVNGLGWKWNLKILIIILLFINLIVLGTNICAERLAIITNKDIPSPFVLEKGNGQVIQINLLGNQLNYSYSTLLNSYTTAKASIQKSWVTVKCNLAPRLEYLDNLWVKGLTQLNSDLESLTNKFNRY